MIKKREFLLYFIIFISVIALMILTHRTFLGVQDEAQLYATLKNGEPLNYMTSYPLALIGGFLYSHFPSMQWYSIIMTFYIVIISFILSLYISKIDFANRYINILLKVIAIVLSILLIVYQLLEVDVTSPTLILIVLAIPLLRYNQIYFWALFWIASFLREQIIFSLLPLIVLAYLIAFKKDFIKDKKSFFISLIFIFGILFNHFSYKLNQTYDKWMDFTEKRAYFTDFGGVPKHNILSEDEFHLARTWWIIDQDLYPYKKVMADAGNIFDIIKLRFSHIPPKKYTRLMFIKHPILYFLILLSILVSLWTRSIIKLILYALFSIAVILLLIVKDVDRVTLPIILLWFSVLVSDFWCIYKNKKSQIATIFIAISLLTASYFIYIDMPKNRITNFKKRENLAKELKDFINKHKNLQLELTTGFPSSWEYLIEAIMQNHLFDEKNWVDYDNDLLLQGWFSRVPLVYKQHNVSFRGVERKYKHYHDWLISPQAAIIGSKGESRHKRLFLIKNLMRMYDEKFPKKGCKHKVIVVDESKHFIIHKVIEFCNNFKNQKPIWNLFDNLNNIKFEKLNLKGKKLISIDKDPKMFIKLENIKSKFVVIHIQFHSSKKDIFQIFYRYKKDITYNEDRSIIKYIKKGDNTIDFILPTKYLSNTIRIDPMLGKGIYKVYEFKIYPLNVKNLFKR